MSGGSQSAGLGTRETSSGGGQRDLRPRKRARVCTCARSKEGGVTEGPGAPDTEARWVLSVSVRLFRFVLVGPLKPTAQTYILSSVDSKMSSILRYSRILCATKKKKAAIKLQHIMDCNTKNTKMWKQKIMPLKSQGGLVCVHTSECIYLI